MNKNNLWVFVLFYASIERVLACQTQNSDCLLHAAILLKQEAHKQKHTRAHTHTPITKAFDRLLVIQS